MYSIAARRVNKRVCQLQPNGRLSRGTMLILARMGPPLPRLVESVPPQQKPHGAAPTRGPVRSGPPRAGRDRRWVPLRGARGHSAFLKQPLAVEEHVLDGALEPPGDRSPYDSRLFSEFAGNLQVFYRYKSGNGCLVSVCLLLSFVRSIR